MKHLCSTKTLLAVCFVVTFTTIAIRYVTFNPGSSVIKTAGDSYQHVPIDHHVFYQLKFAELPDKSYQFEESALLDVMAKNCTFAESLNDTDWIRATQDGQVMSIRRYKEIKREEFMKLKANPTKKSEVRPTVQPFDQNAPANPTGRLKDPNEAINFDENFAEVQKERERCDKLGNTNILQIPEVQAEMKQTEYKIPNIVHFIWFSCNPFRVDHYMAVMGALRYQRPRVILFHTNCEPQGDYWLALKRIAGPKMVVVKRNPPEKIWGLDIKVVEHHADVVRLQLMLEVGGMYMDTDSIILQNLDSFRKFDIVLGQETMDAVANGIILASRNSWFLHRWFWEYKYFRDDIWGHNSVLVPWGIWKYFPKTIHIESNTFCRPNWGELNLLYYDLMDWSKSYVMHLYTRFMAAYDGTRERPLKELAVLNTTFGEVARHVIFGNKEVRDITNWIVTCDIKEILYSARPLPPVVAG